MSGVNLVNPVHYRLNDDLEFFAEHAPLIIKDDQGKFLPFKFNRAQRYIHDRLEAQRKVKGYVRALVVKGRQQGASTYINARYYHREVRHTGISTFILSHEGSTTNKLFGMVHRFWENSLAAMRPEIGKDNPREMTFPGLGGDYSAGTAGNEDAGRGGTAQLFHGSEAAYWENAEAIQDSALESIRLAAGTEIILESTANGPKGMFYQKYKLAVKGEGEYIFIFVPWYWESDYEMADDGSPLEAEEEQFIATYFAAPFPYDAAPIPLAQARRKLMWRRMKILDFSTAAGGHIEAGRSKFRRIYPANPTEAFMSTSVGLFRADSVALARATRLPPDDFCARIGGCDPAGEGKKADRTILVIRQGRCLDTVLKWATMEPMRLAGILARVIEQQHLDKLFIDRGYGEGTMYRLWELGFRRQVVGVWFNEGAANPLYLNKRSEIVIEFAKFVNEGGVSIPDAKEAPGPFGSAVCGGDEIQEDLSSMPLDKETSTGVKYVVPKEQIIKEFGQSYDILDAAALTFAHPVRVETGAASRWSKADGSGDGGTAVKKHGGPLTSVNRRRRQQQGEQ